MPRQLIETGQVGLTHSPGAFHTSRDEDLNHLASAGVNRIVCLQQDFELSYAGTGNESMRERASAIERLGIGFTHFPIPDFGTPQIEPAASLVDLVLRDLEHEQRVVIHCFAGLGRAGTIAASLLTRKGLSPADAIRQVRLVRRGAVQTPEQEAFVSQFSAAGR